MSKHTVSTHHRRLSVIGFFCDGILAMVLGGTLFFLGVLAVGCLSGVSTAHQGVHTLLAQSLNKNANRHVSTIFQKEKNNVQVVAYRGASSWQIIKSKLANQKVGPMLRVQDSNPFLTLSGNTWKQAGVWLAVGVCAMKILGLRSLTLLLGLPLFVLVMVVACVDGWVKRGIRRAELSRESAHVFHRLVRLTRRTWFFGVVLFMVSPYAYTSALWSLILALCLGCLMSITVGRYKKYA